MPAIAVLWIDFVREIRWCWEESESLPRLKSNSSIDLSSCLIHQKLQMVHLYFFPFSLSATFPHTRFEQSLKMFFCLFILLLGIFC
jgi:hypothetical protein